MKSFHSPFDVVIVGASGGIGSAFLKRLQNDELVENIYAFSCHSKIQEGDKIITGHLDLQKEDTIDAAAKSISGNVRLIIVATGILHEGDLQPEKSLKYLKADRIEQVFHLNFVGPALVAKHFLPSLPREGKSVFAALSARVGSISDNHIGGWYSYRASKTALNMFLKTASIEMARKYKKAVIMGLHPGTVDTGLSKPFQSQVPDGKLFTPEQSAGYLLDVMDQADVNYTGKVYDWQGEEVLP